MCGIVLTSDCESGCLNLSSITKRGPDFQSDKFHNSIEDFQYFLFASVLNHQGSNDIKQPFEDAKISFLWNGEVYEFLEGEISDCQEKGINDGHAIFGYISETNNILKAFSVIKGPFAFILIDKMKGDIYFGRDRYGRRSLTYRVGDNENIISIGSNPLCIDGSVQDNMLMVKECYPWTKDSLFISEHKGPLIHTQLRNVIFDVPGINKYSINENYSEKVYSLILNAVRKRINASSKYCKRCSQSSVDKCNHSRFGILFSGGLDSTVIAALVDKLLENHISIDLLNVAFEHMHAGKLHSFESCPDRITGLQSFAALKKINPVRKWNFVAINISRQEVINIKEENYVNSYLLKPSGTSVLDESLGLALWFASRGKGSTDDEVDYISPAKVLFSGIGADELFAGYARHRNLFENFGPERVMSELKIELRRIGERNMCRDDREGRFPFLDEDLVEYVSNLDLLTRADLTQPNGVDLGTSTSTDGFQGAAWAPKRAMQFGSRIAKVEGLNPNKCKGHEAVC